MVVRNEHVKRLIVIGLLIAVIATAVPVWFYYWGPAGPRKLHEATFPTGAVLEIHWVPPRASDPADAKGHFAYRIGRGPVRILAGCRYAGPRDNYNFETERNPIASNELMIYELRHGLLWVFDPDKGYVGGNG